MFHNRRASGGILLAISLLLGACGTNAPASPTPDANVIYTAAAETIAVGYTQTAELIPTDTPTPEPTATLAATQAIPTLSGPSAGNNPTAQPAAGTGAGTGAGAAAPTAVFKQSTSVVGKAVATVAGAATGDKASWVSNQPADGSEIGSGAKFNLTWTITNTGTTTWTSEYTARFFYGTELNDTTVVYFPSSVAPGETASLVLKNAVAPTANGEYHTWWKLTNASGQNFGDVDFTFHVGKASASATPTAAK